MSKLEIIFTAAFGIFLLLVLLLVFGAYVLPTMIANAKELWATALA